MPRLPSILFALSLVPAVAAAQQPTQLCIADLNRVDESMDETQARLKDAGTGDLPQKCAAVAHHIEVMSKAVEVYLRCQPAGHDRDETLGQIAGTIADFRDIHAALKCAGALVPASATSGGQGIGRRP
jgi:hypothetical protein